MPRLVTSFDLEEESPAHIPLPSPEQVSRDIPLDEVLHPQIKQYRKEIGRVLHHTDPRLLVVVGPCSIHDPKAAIEFAERLASFQEEVKEDLLLVMRAYFEKPRTTIGWKGFINDPDLDGSFNVEKGIILARDLLVKLAQIGVPVATEVLDTSVHHYLSDLISWSAIGARTAESQIHREVASFLASPVGFKNTTDGRIDVAIDAIEAARHPHASIGVGRDGKLGVHQSRGNKNAHLILRGGKKPNYDELSIAAAEEALSARGLHPSVMIDCSHGNSGKDPSKQPDILNAVVEQKIGHRKSITGVMIESHLGHGSQKLHSSATLQYGVSITDPCLGWDETAEALREAAALLQRKR